MRKISAKENLLAKINEQNLVRLNDFEGTRGVRVHISQIVADGELVRVGRRLYAPR